MIAAKLAALRAKAKPGYGSVDVLWSWVMTTRERAPGCRPAGSGLGLGSEAVGPWPWFMSGWGLVIWVVEFISVWLTACNAIMRRACNLGLGCCRERT